ncbi:MAG TPA: hypothetical protein VF306_20235 [Pirellulales bacterium]
MTDTHDNLGPESLAAAREYFRQLEPRFWEWDDDAITWCGQSTIVFRQELRQIVERLAPDGLPHFTELLLLLAACREGWSRNRLEQVLCHEFNSLTLNSLPDLSAYNEPLAELQRIHNLPAELRTSIEAKTALAEIVFAGYRVVGPKGAFSVAAVLSLPPTPEIFLSQRRRGSRPHVAAALSAMREGLARLDADQLRMRLRTGLDRLIEPAEVEPPPLGLREFIAQLRNDDELAGLGRLASELMAATQLPRALSHPDELPLGGVSDLTNRGPLDRLLVSELAHDDLTLAVRVAVGEALYLRREAPPSPPARRRLVLVDSGIRLWGVPRVFATAVGLAMAATAERQAASCYHATAEGIEPIELGTRAGLIDQLERLETAPHPAAALSGFFAAARAAGQHADRVLITHEDVWADAEFRAELSAHVGRAFQPDTAAGHAPFYIATVERGGRFRLLAVTPRGSKLLRDARLDLERLAPRPKPSSPPLIRYDEGSELPAILSVEPFPLLLTHDPGPGPAAFHPDYGAVTVAHDGRLMHWQKPGWAARQITDQVPRGRTVHISLDGQGVVRLVVSSPSQPLRLLVANLRSRDCNIMSLECQATGSLHIEVHRGVLLVVRTTKRTEMTDQSHGQHADSGGACSLLVQAVNDRGQMVGSVGTLADVTSGRFLRRGARWLCASFDGQAVKLAEFPVHPSLWEARVRAMFDRAGHDGPWAITETGRIVSTVDGRTAFGGLHGLVDVVAISARGDRVILRERASLKDTIIDLTGIQAFIATDKSGFAGSGDRDLLDPAVNAYIRPISIRHRFRTVGIDTEGCLTLVGRRGQIRLWRTESIASSARNRAEWVAGLGQPLRHASWFTHIKGPTGVRFRVRVARWRDGSRAYLDSRGLLHLKSGDRKLPEVSVILCFGGKASAWASDGRRWGNEFYTGLQPDALSPPEELGQLIGEFIARLQ